MIGIFLGIELVWLLVISVALVAVIRYMGTLQATGAGPTIGQGAALLDTDGPWIPSPLPDRVVSAFRTHSIQFEDLVATFFSPSCGTCLERAEQVAAALVDPDRNVFLVTGDLQSAKDMSDILAGTGVPILTDPDAQNIVKSLEIRSTPFTFRVIGGQIVAKSFVRGTGDYLRMFDADRPAIESPVPAVGDQRLVASTEPGR
jgi:hypothetical protein